MLQYELYGRDWTTEGGNVEVDQTPLQNQLKMQQERLAQPYRSEAHTPQGGGNERQGLMCESSASALVWITSASADASFCARTCSSLRAESDAPLNCFCSVSISRRFSASLRRFSMSERVFETLGDAT